MSEASPVVGIVGGSRSDFPVSRRHDAARAARRPVRAAASCSAHRTPDHLFRYAETARDRGIRVIIAGAGGAAHLPGMLAAKTTLPVIGVPVPTQHLGGLDSLLVDRPDAARHPGRDGRHRQRRERGAAGRAILALGDAGLASPPRGAPGRADRGGPARPVERGAAPGLRRPNRRPADACPARG